MLLFLLTTAVRVHTAYSCGAVHNINNICCAHGSICVCYVCSFVIVYV